MVSPTNGVTHAVIHVNGVVSSPFLWITLGKSGLELLKRVLLEGFFCCSLFVCLAYSFCILLLMLLLWTVFAICGKKIMLLGFSKGLCLLARVSLILLT